MKNNIRTARIGAAVVQLDHGARVKRADRVLVQLPRSAARKDLRSARFPALLPRPRCVVLLELRQRAERLSVANAVVRVWARQSVGNEARRNVRGMTARKRRLRAARRHVGDEGGSNIIMLCHVLLSDVVVEDVRRQPLRQRQHLREEFLATDGARGSENENEQQHDR